jgi:hypothetical protein
MACRTKRPSEDLKVSKKKMKNAADHFLPCRRCAPVLLSLATRSLHLLKPKNAAASPTKLKLKLKLKLKVLGRRKRQGRS